MATADDRQTRVFNGALALLLHRNGPNATVWTAIPECGSRIRDAAKVAAILEAEVEAALGQPKPF